MDNRKLSVFENVTNNQLITLIKEFKLMETRTYKVYKFSELDDDQKEKAIENFRDNNLDYDWWDNTTDDVITIGKLWGINIDKVYFSGFCSQGDGACFEGSFTYEKGSLKAVKDYASKDTELHNIIERWQGIQRKCFYVIKGSVKQSGHYMHENCTDFDVRFESDFSYADFYSDDNEETVKEIVRDYMRWIYKRLESEYEYLQSDEAIIETIEANDYDFTEDGVID